MSNRSIVRLIALSWSITILTCVYVYASERNEVQVAYTSSKPHISYVSSQPQNKPAYFDIPVSEDLQDFTRKVCEVYQLDERIMYGIMYVESRFQEDAVSSVGCQGLMQVTPSYADTWLSTSRANKILDEVGANKVNLFHPYTNIVAGAEALTAWREAAQKYDNILPYLYLDAYHKGWKAFSQPYYDDYATVVLEYAEEITYKENDIG